MLTRTLILILMVSAVAHASAANESGDDNSDTPAPVKSRPVKTLKFSKATATQEALPNVITYSFNVSTTEEITHTIGSYIQVSKNWTLIAVGNVAYAGANNSVNSGNLGAETILSKYFTARFVGSGTGGAGVPFALGGIGTLTTNLNPLWGSNLSTRLVTGGGYNQSYLSPGVDPFGLRQQVFNGMANISIYHQVEEPLELGLSYTYYGFFDSRPGRSSAALIVNTRLGRRANLSTSIVENHDQLTNQDSYALAEAVSFDISSQVAVGIHGSAFQQAVGTDGPTSTSGIAPVGLYVRSIGESNGAGQPPMTIGFSGGLDFTLRW